MASRISEDFEQVFLDELEVLGATTFLILLLMTKARRIRFSVNGVKYHKVLVGLFPTVVVFCPTVNPVDATRAGIPHRLVRLSRRCLRAEPNDTEVEAQYRKLGIFENSEKANAHRHEMKSRDIFHRQNRARMMQAAARSVRNYGLPMTPPRERTCPPRFLAGLPRNSAVVQPTRLLTPLL
jgi:hypothetical protein